MVSCSASVSLSSLGLGSNSPVKGFIRNCFCSECGLVLGVFDSDVVEEDVDTLFRLPKCCCCCC